MIKRKQISVYIEEEDKNLINEASKIIGLELSQFCRSCSIKEARKILEENQNGI